LLSMVVTMLVVVALFMGASSLAFAVVFHAMRGMYLHAERLLAKAGGSNCKPRGIPTLATKRSESGKGGAQRRSAQAKRGRLGSGLRARGAELPLAAFAVVLVLRGGALRGGWTAPLRWVAQDAERPKPGRKLHPLAIKPFGTANGGVRAACIP
jgi:hypothetical protein